MLDINGALKAIGYGLLVLFFAVGVVKTCGSFTDVKRPEHALKLFIRFALAKAAVTYGLDLMLAVFKIVQGIISTIITQSGLSGSSGTTLPQEIIDKINNVGFWDSIPLWAVTLLGGLFITVLSFIMILKGLIAAIAAGGWVAVVIILLICLIALIVGSCFGLFFGSDSTGTGTSVTQAVTTLNGEFQAHIQEIEDSNSHDRVEFTSNDGVLSINWEDVLAVFSAKVTGAEDGAQVASLDDTQVQQLRDIMWEMNAVSSSTRTESHEVEVTEVDEDGKETTHTETVTETILEISLTHKTAEKMAQQYNFNARQNEYLALMSEPENQNLWAELLGGFSSGGGQIMNPNTDWEGTGIFQWPLPQSYTITSWFGYREDPFTGEIAYHSGTDIGAPGGTPILAAADGTVTIANAIDSWGGGYGYHIKISHNDTFDTLYAHCSSICVTVGQKVKQGEVIGYVGTTGNSTGNHLHFEVWQNGERTDALGYFKAKE